jgi:hypothetical protein
VRLEIVRDEGPPKRKSLQKGAEVPWRLHFQTLGVAVFHGHLKKVAVVLKVHPVAEWTKIERRIELLEGNV